MAVVEFSRFTFYLHQDIVKGLYGGRYSFELPFDDFQKIDSSVRIRKNTIEFPSLSQKSAHHKLNALLFKALHSLTNTVTGKEVLYIDGSKGIPLIGAIDFGIIDRDTNVLELKPSTGCNLNCIYCSVAEGGDKKQRDVLVDDAYLVQEVAKIASKKNYPVECNINPTGEPLLYPFIVDLIEQLREVEAISTISMNTNATLLTKDLAMRLKKAGLSRLNVSLNTFDEKTAQQLSGTSSYNVQKIKAVLEFCSSINLPVLIAPVIVPTFNDASKRDLEPLVAFATKIKSPYPTIGFQKFLKNKNGRNPVQEISFDEFFSLLKPFEKKYGVVLTPQKNYNPFAIFSDKTLSKPFHKHSVIRARIVSPARRPHDFLCVADNRVITLRGALKTKGVVAVKLIRDKHNIFAGVPA